MHVIKKSRHLNSKEGAIIYLFISISKLYFHHKSFYWQVFTTVYMISNSVAFNEMHDINFSCIHHLPPCILFVQFWMNWISKISLLLRILWRYYFPAVRQILNPTHCNCEHIIYYIWPKISKHLFLNLNKVSINLFFFLYFLKTRSRPLWFNQMQ